jgi:CBS domain-containing protein
MQKLDGIAAENLLVRMQPAGWNNIGLSELKKMVIEGKGDLTLRSVLPIRQVPYLHPDQSLDIALRSVARWPILPVVSRANITKLEGVITKDDVWDKYFELGEEFESDEP